MTSVKCACTWMHGRGSRRELGALAYTVGPDIVFGAGQYAPHTTAGGTLLAHELTHVTQREVGNVIRRRPTAQEIRAEKRAAWLKGLADHPGDAHREWKRLTTMEKLAVVVQMTTRYGQDFAKSFLWYTEHPIEPTTHTFGPGFPEHTPEWFQARGYQLWRRSSINEIWVHPSGNMMMQILDRRRKDLGQRADENCGQLAEVTLSILRDTISAERAMKQELEDWKRQLEGSNKTTDDYRQQYDEYIQALQAFKDRLVDAAEDIALMREQLAEMNCPAVSTIDLELQELSDLQIWVDIESSPISTQFLQPRNVAPIQ